MVLGSVDGSSEYLAVEDVSSRKGGVSRCGMVALGGKMIRVVVYNWNQVLWVNSRLCWLQQIGGCGGATMRWNRTEIVSVEILTCNGGQLKGRWELGKAIWNGQIGRAHV